MAAPLSESLRITPDELLAELCKDIGCEPREAVRELAITRIACFESSIRLDEYRKASDKMLAQLKGGETNV